MLLKPFDIGIVLCALAAVAASFFLTDSNSGGSSLVNVRGENGQWVFPIDSVESIVVSGPLGDTVVELGGGGACITSSPCLNQTCVSAGRILAQGQWAACLPNRVMIYIDEGESNNNVDASAW
ncbi:MAG: NusG domain II-containing protein [Treponema sp.]|jgi:hypothetical protein|nr:NusG domain II-containing protein [Treponema sp.]